MALTTQTVNDTLYYPDGTPMAGAFITFTLVGTGTSPEDSGTIPSSTYTETTSSGGFFSVNLWPNVLGYAGTNYKVEVSYTDTTTGKYVTKKVGTIQVPDEVGPHDLSELLEQNVVAGGAFYLGLITQEQYDTVLNVQANADIATLAAIAAGAPLVIELTNPVPTDDTVELLQTTSGTQVWEVQAGGWVQIGWLGIPVFPTIAAMALAEGMIDSQPADVEDGFNGEKERFQYDSGGTLPADGVLVVDGVGGQWVSKRTVYASDAEFADDPRGYGFFAADNLVSIGGIPYVVLASGAANADEENAGGVKLGRADAAYVDLGAPLHFTTTTYPKTLETRLPTTLPFMVSDDAGGFSVYGQDVAGTYSDGPQVFDMANGGQAYTRTIHPAASGLDGVFSTKGLGHRAGDFQYQVMTNAQARMLTDLDKFKPQLIDDLAFRVKYVDGVNGSDANDGLTWATAQKSIQFALNQNACDIIYVKCGVYYEPTFTWSRTTSLSIISVGGPVEVVYGEINTDTYGEWAVNGTYANVRQLNSTGASTATLVMDRQYSDGRGPRRFTKVASLAACAATDYSWYQDAGKVVYVNRVDNGGDITGDEVVVSTDNDWTFQLRHITQAGTIQPTRVFFKGVHIYGGRHNLLVQSYASTPDEGTVFFHEDCRFYGSSNTNGLRVLDVGLCIGVRSGAHESYRDGFNYTAANSQSPHFVEVDCWATDSGYSGDSNNNASTSHDDCRGFRLNTQGIMSSGPTIADVGTAKTWNVCCLGQYGSTSCFTLANTAEVWLHGGYYQGTRTSVSGGRRDLRLSDTTKLHMRGVTSGFPAYNEAGTATIDADGFN